MKDIIDPLTQQCLPGERQWLRSALLTDQGGMLTATRQRLARLARARGVEPHAIDDVVQETLLEAWSHLERLHSPAGFQPWIDEICRNICRRAARRREMDLLRHAPQALSIAKQGESLDEVDPLADLPIAADTDPFEALSRQDLMVLLDRAIGMLPPATRQIVEMCYLLELPHTVVAERLNISNGTLDVRLHRARRHLLHILHGPLRCEAEALGLTLDEALVEGWQQTRLWCPLCARHRLEGCFINPEAGDGHNLHLRCPECSRIYKQDTVHSMGLIPLSGLHSFRPAWKHTMQGLTDRVLQALWQDQHPCLYCGKPALVQVKSNDTATDPFPGFRNGEPEPYPFWIYLYCTHCGNSMNECGCLPSVDQLVYWSHPLTRQFLQQHQRWTSEPGKSVEYNGEPAIHFQITDLESCNSLTVLAHRQTLRILTVSGNLAKV